jgi:hypothetical protein
MPTSSPTTRHHTITTTQTFHVQRVGNAGGELWKETHFLQAVAGVI